MSSFGFIIHLNKNITNNLASLDQKSFDILMIRSVVRLAPIPSLLAKHPTQPPLFRTTRTRRHDPPVPLVGTPEHRGGFRVRKNANQEIKDCISSAETRKSNYPSGARNAGWFAGKSSSSTSTDYKGKSKPATSIIKRFALWHPLLAFPTQTQPPSSNQFLRGVGSWLTL